MQVKIEQASDWRPILCLLLGVVLLYAIPDSFSEVGLKWDQLDLDVFRAEGAILPKFRGFVRAAVGFAVGFVFVWATAPKDRYDLSCASSGAGIAIFMAVILFFLPYVVAFCSIFN